MGGQLFAPHTSAKWILGSQFMSATLKRGSFFWKDFLNEPIGLRLALSIPFSISFKEYL